MNKILLSVVLASTSFCAVAGIDKIAETSDTGIHLMWWPKVTPPKGWHFDEGSSHRYAFNAMAPDGRTFSDAETVMYAKASYKPNMPGVKSLDAFADSDVSDPQWAEIGVSATPMPTIRSGDGKPWKVFDFAPGKEGNWERTVYGEEGDFWLVFTLSSRTEAGFRKALPVFESLVGDYREKP